MKLQTNEKIRILAGRRNLTLKELAEKLGMSRQNLNNKLTRNNFSEKQLRDIAEALNCTLDITFTTKDTGESI
ncbi:MAG: helix-turn-helix transcriptional regulator [Oscillospiraceae bacterium]|jgi:transcriptional regulator with XRE-family HTH domain